MRTIKIDRKTTECPRKEQWEKYCLARRSMKSTLATAAAQPTRHQKEKQPSELPPSGPQEQPSQPQSHSNRDTFAGPTLPRKGQPTPSPNIRYHKETLTPQ